MAKKRKEDENVADIIYRRDESRKFVRVNYWDEWTQIYQAINCRTSPIYKTVDGKQVEDKSRTNVAMPDLSIMHRRNVARFTAQPYRLEYTGVDERIAESLTAKAIQDYDHSNEHEEDRNLVLQSEAFGVAYSKLSRDKIKKITKFRKQIVKGDQVINRKRSDIMAAQGAPQDEIEDAVDQQGENMSDDELSQFIAKSGNEITVPDESVQYDGNIVKACLPGSVFIAPGARNLDMSDYVVEEYIENDIWLKDRAKIVITDPMTGAERPMFDPAVVKELLDNEYEPLLQVDDLRRMFLGSIGKLTDDQYQTPKKLRKRKVYNIIEQHAQDEDGRMWITYVCENFRDKVLGKIPYEWDLDGQYAYTELLPLPDIMLAQGLSTPRLNLFLYKMHNRTVAQNFDYVTNLIKLLLLKKRGVDIDDPVDRGDHREIQCSDTGESAIRYLQPPPLPPGAMDREAQLMRMMSLSEPALTATDAGTQGNPMAGKTATTAVLASKASDALTQWKLDGRDIYLRKLGTKKLRMDQQAMREPAEIKSKYFTDKLKSMTQGQQMPDWAYSDQYGKTVVRLDPMDIQTDIQVEPQAGSYLAVDDDLRLASVQQLEQAAAIAPELYDRREIAKLHLSTIRNIGDPNKYLLPPVDPNTPPPMPPPKVGVNVSIPFPTLPPDVQNAALQLIGFPASPTLTLAAQDAPHQATLDGVNKMAEAANSAADLMSPAQPETPQGIDAQARRGQ